MGGGGGVKGEILYIQNMFNLKKQELELHVQVFKFFIIYTLHYTIRLQ